MAAASGSLPSTGLAPIDITGSNLGLDPRYLAVYYHSNHSSGVVGGLSARNYSIPAGLCVIIDPGAHIQCPSVPGVGANLTFVVVVGGGVSAPSRQLLSYTRPAISAIHFVGASKSPTSGGALIVFEGANLGPASVTPVLTAVGTQSSLSFHATNCTVAVNHTALQCVTGPGIGAATLWSVGVEGLHSDVFGPMHSYGSPVVESVSFLHGPLASTRGGTGLVLAGSNFGGWASHVVVEITAGSVVRVVAPVACTVNDTAMVCPMPPGTGVLSKVTLSVLDQSVTKALNSSTGLPVLAYAPPKIDTVLPKLWGTDLGDLNVTITGSGLGDTADAVQVIAVGTTGCRDAPTVSVSAQAVGVVNDSMLWFSLKSTCLCLPHFVAEWALVVIVAEQSVQVASAVRTRTPSPPTLSFDVTRARPSPFNGSHYFLTVETPPKVHLSTLGAGSTREAEYGSSLSSCSSDVNVTVDGTPCAQLTMTEVSACLPHFGPDVLRRP